MILLPHILRISPNLKTSITKDFDLHENSDEVKVPVHQPKNFQQDFVDSENYRNLLCMR